MTHSKITARVLALSLAASLFAPAAGAQDNPPPVGIDEVGKLQIHGNAVVVEPDGSVSLGGGRVTLGPKGKVEISRNGRNILSYQPGKPIILGKSELFLYGTYTSLGRLKDGGMAIQTWENGEVSIGRNDNGRPNIRVQENDSVSIGHVPSGKAAFVVRNNGHVETRADLTVNGNLGNQLDDGKTYPVMLGFVSVVNFRMDSTQVKNCHGVGAGYCAGLEPRCYGGLTLQRTPGSYDTETKDPGSLGRRDVSQEIFGCFSGTLPQPDK